MKTKQKILDLPYSGYDYGIDLGVPYDVLIGDYGNPIIGIQIINPVLQLSADPQSYISAHSVLNQIAGLIGEEHIIQKLDIFAKRKYEAEKVNNYLGNKYSEHFEGRPFKTIETVLFITDLIDFSSKKTTYKYNEKSYKELRDKCQKAFMILQEYGFSPKFLKKDDYEYFIGGCMSMNWVGTPHRANIKTDKDGGHFKVGKYFTKSIPIVDVEKQEFPTEIEPFAQLGNGVAAETAVDNFTFLNELDEYHTIIYHQTLSIPHQAKRHRDLDKRKKKAEGLQNTDATNAYAVQDIAELQAESARDGQLLADVHLSMVIACDTLDELEKTYSQISNKLYNRSIILSDNDHNQMELFSCLWPGQAVKLKQYNYFMTSVPAGLCFFFKESYTVNEESNINLRFTNRQGVPIKVDLSDLPMSSGRINNRNKFVLGPSGSGKSFLMNNIVEQYLNYNYDVVIVDTGDSYSALAKYKKAKYIQYTDENPITMNPFKMVNKSDLNVEKIEFLTNLIFLIWKGQDAAINTTEKSILNNLLTSYYDQYFNANSQWYKNYSDSELITILNKFNIHEDDIHREVNYGHREKTYYDILGVAFDAPTAEIRKTGRALIQQTHPDRNQGNKDYNPDTYYKIYEAYDTLTDEERRKVYNETALILAMPLDVEKTISEDDIEGYGDESSQAYRFRYALIKRIKQIQKELNVENLSFNSFYNYAAKFLPMYLNNRDHPVTNDFFNLDNFKFVLKDFYKGGKYERTLNEDGDTTLFDETFIVFEIDNVKDNPTLFPIITLIIMDTFIQKMRHRPQQRKALIIEEAWKAIANKLMGGYILYLYKTVRKFWGEAIVVTQELDDILGNAIVKDSIINNSDTFVLLDQTKFKDNFERIANLLSLNKVEQNKIWTINNLNNKQGRSKFKEFYIKRGSKGEVYGNEVSLHQYLTYTTEKPEKQMMEYYYSHYKDSITGLDTCIKHMDALQETLQNMTILVNLYKKPIDKKLFDFYKNFRNINKKDIPIKILSEKLKSENITLEQLINKNKVA